MHPSSSTHINTSSRQKSEDLNPGLVLSIKLPFPVTEKPRQLSKLDSKAPSVSLSSNILISREFFRTRCSKVSYTSNQIQLESQLGYIVLWYTLCPNDSKTCMPISPGGPQSKASTLMGIWASICLRPLSGVAT